MNISDEDLKKAIASVMGTPKPKISLKYKMILISFGLIIGLIGTIIIIKTLGWLPMLGIFLLLWSNNIGNKK